MEPRFFPVGMEVMGATMRFGQLPDTIELFDGRVKVSSLALDHPGTSYAYRVEADGHSFVMATDGEYKELTGPYWQRYVDFYRDADVLIFDAQYTLREALFEKQNWGHSSAMIGIDLAAEAGVGTIVMVHHEPSYPDEKVRGIFEDALRYVDRTPSANRPQVAVAYEGLVLDL
jgi:ribonuclease BN (tRNA processing enzyme)